MNKEIEFTNGNMSKVFYDGHKIYRDMKVYSKTIHRLLLHLEKKNITFTPHLLGIDNDKNQEILSFIEGEAIENYPLINDINYKIQTVELVAKMLRVYHDATIDFVQKNSDTWFLEYKGNLEKEVICHNDIAPYNVTFVDNKPFGIIDFDTACPGPRVWDVAYAIYRFVPLSREVYIKEENTYRAYNKEIDCLEKKILIEKFLKAYGMDDVAMVMENVILRLQALVDLFDEECNKGNELFIKMREEGHQDFYIKEIEFIKANIEDWTPIKKK